MDPKVTRLETPEQCDSFIENVEDSSPDLVEQANRWKVQLLAGLENQADPCERACIEAILAYNKSCTENVRSAFVRHELGKKSRKLGLFPRWKIGFANPTRLPDIPPSNGMAYSNTRSRRLSIDFLTVSLPKPLRSVGNAYKR